MKVAFVDQSGDAIGGAERSLSTLLQYLPADIVPSAYLFGDGTFASELRAAGIRTCTLQIGSGVSSSTRERPRVEALGELASIIRALSIEFRRDQIDLVHTNTIKAHIIGGAAARLCNIPCVAHLRDILHGTSRAIVRSSLRSFTRHRIAISGVVSSAFNLKNTHVVDNPLDLKAFANLPNRIAARRSFHIFDDRPVALMIGRINRWKGHDRFLRALAVANKVTPIRGLIVGAPVFRDADFLPELLDLRQSLGLNQLVDFFDWVDDVRMPYAATDIHVSASTREPFGRTVIEAAAAEIPSVCFDDSGVSELMSSNMGTVVPAHDEAALASAILRYASDVDFRRTSGRFARQWSQRFDAARHANRVTEILTRAASERR
jgi:glycosyltransferase involved in cell wall biosynthesis